MEGTDRTSSQSQQPAKAPMMGVFFSPPEAPMPDTFHATIRPFSHAPPTKESYGHVRLPSIRQILSPPVSPATNLDQEPVVHGPHSGRLEDPELFPHRLSMTQADAVQPLFRPNESDLSVEAIVDNHIQTAALAAADRRPSRDDYMLTATFRSKVVDRFNADPTRYWKQELEFLSQYPKMFSPAPTTGKRKSEAESRPAKRQRAAPRTTVEKLPVLKRQPRQSPREAPLDAPAVEQPVKHKRKPSQTVPMTREDMDYRKIADKCPPVSSMAPGKNLKIDWKGHPLDLSDDPDRDVLDEQEVNLASILRLSAGQYLFAKRKIFERYVELARVGKDFNKTSAQAVCHIDVNKASKLWTAFEKVGWFDRKHFTQYL